MYAYAGKILCIDLTKEKIVINELDKSIARRFLGGRGFTSKLLFDSISPDIEPFAPENAVIIAVGPLAGTLSPSSGRFTVASKSPLTGILGDANSGGHFGAELKYAGFDAIVIMGRARVPSYVFIEDGCAEIRAADMLWGKSVGETEKMVKEDVEDKEARVLTIGSAGENLVRYAALINDFHRAAARCGIGAVFGSKNLKAVVVRGTGGVDIASFEKFKDALTEAFEAVYNDPVYSTLSELGTPFLMDAANEEGGLATRNNQSGVFEYYEDISQSRYTKEFKVRSFACFACPIHCSNISKIASASGGDLITEGPEYETMVCLGSKCGIRSLETIIKANKMCNEYGIDTISCGDSIAFAMELWENGILNEKNTEGLDLSWGNEDSVLKLIEDIATRKGIGKVLGEGVKRASQHFGKRSKKYALHVKGLELPAFDVRAAKGFGLGWAVSTRGADHLRALPNFELLGFSKEVAVKRFKSPYACDPYEERGKAYLVFWHENFSAAVDSAEMCKYETFSTYAVTPAMLSRLIEAATGFEMGEDKLLKIGERIINLEKIMNISFAGIVPDTLPERIVKEPLPSGPAKGNVVNLDKMLCEYYLLRGWDKRGIPTKDRLVALDMEKEFSGIKSLF
ncbi:MAG: aldehyde ferredoxin oxidoreductase family protein [Candidatus Methanofastidiosia archaeon]